MAKPSGSRVPRSVDEIQNIGTCGKPRLSALLIGVRSIAQTLAPDQDPRATINDIKDLNGMNTAVVAVGQSIVVPVIR